MLKNVVFYALSVIIASVGAAASAEDCDLYTVVKGDTLRVIAEQYYGAREFSPILYDANIDIVGADPNTIEIGMELSIPCREGIQVPLARSLLTVVEPTITPHDITLQVLSKPNGPPFMGADGNGVVPNILSAALQKSGYFTDFELAAPQTSEEIMRVSIAEAQAVISFPWIKPDCQNPEFLSEQSAALCMDFEFSDPLFEIVLGLFVRRGDLLSSAEMASAFSGKNICVPGFHSEDMLRRNGIFAVQGDLIFASDFNTCRTGLENGEYDVIVADYQSFSTFNTAEVSVMVDVPAFAHSSTLHAIAYSGNLSSIEVLGAVNTSLQQMLTSGEWFGIVSQNLAAPVN